MDRRFAKRLACGVAARYVERWLTSTHGQFMVREKDEKKLDEAVLEIVDELDRRSRGAVGEALDLGILS